MRFEIGTTALLVLMGCADIEKDATDWPLAEAEPTPTAVFYAGSVAPDEPEPYDYSSAEQLLAQAWTEQMVGCATQWMWEDFSAGGAFTASEELPNWSEEGDVEVLWSADGSWTIDGHGTVEWSWTRDDRTVLQRRSWAPVSGALASAVSWSTGEGVAWPSGGFAPSDAALTRFRNEWTVTTTRSDDVYVRGGVTTDVVFSRPLAEILSGGECALSVRASTASGEFTELELGCAVTPHDDPQLLVVHAESVDPDWYAASEQWRLELEAQGHYELYDEAVADELRVATVPVFLVDRDTPTALVSPGGYSVLGTRAP